MGEPDQVYAARITKGGRLRIPPRVLEELKVKDGDQVLFFLRPDKRAAVMTRLMTSLIRPEF